MFGGKEKKRKNFWTKHWRSKFNKQIFVMVFRLWWIKMTNSGIQRKKLEMNFFLHRIRLWKHKNKRFIHMKKKNLNQNITHTNRERDFRTNWIESFFLVRMKQTNKRKNWSVWILKLKFNPFSSVGYDDKNFFLFFVWKFEEIQIGFFVIYPSMMIILIDVFWFIQTRRMRTTMVE